MGQAFYSSISGIKGGQNAITVVADNLANMNTVAFKESGITFSDVYYNNVTTGSSATNTLGGTNPLQYGTGSKTSSISKNYATGSQNTTGVDTDMMIQGNGFFTVKDSSNQLLYTKAGNFSLDAEGYLITSNGYRVLGTSNQFGIQSGDTPIYIPQAMKTETTPTDAATLGAKEIDGLNNMTITAGDFSMTIGGTSATVNIADHATIDDVLASINAALGTIGGGTANLVDGQLQIKSTSGNPISFESGTSNFLKATGLSSAAPAADGTYSSKTLDYTQNISVADDDVTSVKYSGLDVKEDGSLEVKYSNGDKLSVESNADTGALQFRYTTASGVIIRGTDVKVSNDVVEPANLQLQLATFVNTQGLVAEGNNCYSAGPNSGQAFYGKANANGFGGILGQTQESSNVDMTKQFTNMILAQRAIEANSRVFNTQSEILKNLSYLGQ